MSFISGKGLPHFNLFRSHKTQKFTPGERDAQKRDFNERIIDFNAVCTISFNPPCSFDVKLNWTEYIATSGKKIIKMRELFDERDFV